MSKVRVYCAFLSNGTVIDSQSYVLREMQERYKDHVELVYPTKLIQRIFHDAARCAAVEEFLETDCDVMWFLDSDVTPPKHVLDLVALHYSKWQVAGACYPVFMAQPGEEDRQVVFTAYKGSDGKGLRPGPIPMEGQEFVDGLATGCLFIKRSVFAQLQKPYFEFKYDPETRVPIEGEDLGFCMKLAKLGIKFFTDYSMVCKHQKNLCLLEMNNYAISYANKAVLAYDADIKEKVAAAVKAAYRQGKKEGLEANKAPTPPKSGLILPNHLT